MEENIFRLFPVELSVFTNSFDKNPEWNNLGEEKSKKKSNMIGNMQPNCKEIVPCQIPWNMNLRVETIIIFHFD